MMACPLCGRTMAEGSRPLPDGRVVVACSSGHSTAAVATERTKLAHREDAELLAALGTEEGIPTVDELEAERARPSRYYADHAQGAAWRACYACGDTQHGTEAERCRCGCMQVTPPRGTEDEAIALVRDHDHHAPITTTGGRGMTDREVNRALDGS